MTRINLILLGLAIACALGVVTSQHKARKSFVDLQREQELTTRLDEEYGQLQLEASTWAMHGRVEQIASGRLGMRVPPPARVQVIPGIAAGEERR